MNILWQDLRHAVRLLTRTPVLTAVVLVTVALGVGANTAVFAVVDAALLRALPYPQADRIVIAEDMAPGEIVDWRAESHSFTAMAALKAGTFDLTTSTDRPERLDGVTTDYRFFDVMGVSPAIGRSFTADDQRAGGRVAVLSDALWRTRFGGDRAVVGRSVVLNGESYVVIGVMPAGFRFPDTTQIWVPPTHEVPDHPLRPGVDLTHNHGSHYLGAYARLRPDVSLDAAQAEQRAIFTRMIHDNPKDMVSDDLDVPLVPLRDWLVGDIKTAVLVLLAVVVLVLLIACANIANLLLARASARAQEISVRAALGAGRMRIARQLLTESALLALLGGGLGVLTAAWTLPTITAISPTDVASLHPALSTPVLLFALGISLVTGLIFGCAPALQATGSAMALALRSVGRTTDGVQTARLRQALIVAECAASVTLLVLAGLLIRSFDSLLHVNPGFDAANRQVAYIVLPTSEYSTPDKQARFFRAVLDRVDAAPGVTGAALAARLPFLGGNSTRGIVLDHQTSGNPAAGIRVISPGYFKVIGQPLLRGREFTGGDTSAVPGVAVVNETMAKTFWPGQNAIGHHFTIGSGPSLDVVGVAADVKHGSLREEIAPEFYQPFEQAPWSFMAVVIETPMTPVATSAMVNSTLAAIDPALPAPAVRRMSDLIGRSVALDRFQMVGLVVFAAVGLILAMVGLYGVMSYVVSRRTREIGLRIALGASPSGIVALVMRDGLRLTSLGIGMGLVGALAAARVIQSWLFGVRTWDPITFAAVAVVLAATAALACYVPARRAMSVDPMTALRTE
jgi:putative ABC transport system permease protein